MPVIRACTETDISAVAGLYAGYVSASLRSFETVPPDAEEIQRRWQSIRAHQLPYLVAEGPDGIIGFGYAAPYRPRPAYRYTAEDSVYISPSAQGQGVGGLLLSAIITACEEAGMRQMIAVITDADADASLALHTRLGFHAVGRLEAVGRKEDQWLDTIIMQRSLGDGATSPLTEESAEAHSR